MPITSQLRKDVLNLKDTVFLRITGGGRSEKWLIETEILQFNKTF